MVEKILYSHQGKTIDFINHVHGRALIASDPGTGKTATILKWFADHVRVTDPHARLLVLAPRAICHPAWAKDAATFTPHLRVAVATGNSAYKARVSAMPHDVLVTNHDSVTQEWFEGVVKNYTTCVIDESTAFKGPTSKRTKALLKLAKHWKHRIAMSGTPMPQSVLDLWAQLAFIDPSLVGPYTAWRSQVTYPRQVMIGGGRSVIQYDERPGIRETLMTRYANTIIRFAKRDCIDLPAQTVRTMAVECPPVINRLLDEFRREMALQLEGGEVITAAHAGAMATKLLQVTSGFVYGNGGEPKLIDPTRYELVTELVGEREHSLIAVRFRAQAEFLSDRLTHFGMPHAILDGSTSAQDAERIVREFQEGKYRTLICQPQAVSHGLTLTRADTVIWASPTFNGEHFVQFNARIDRIGQRYPTEVICVAAEGTYEEAAYCRLFDKVENQRGMLDFLRKVTLGV